MKKVFARLARQSPAMIVAMIALFVATTGTAVATSSALIGGAQIRNNSITGADIKNKSLRPIDFRGSVRGARGVRGLAGPPGPPGPPGAQGIQGPPGAPNPNADKLDGYDANQLNRVVTTYNTGDNFIEADGNTDIASVTLNVPVKSFVKMTFSASGVASTLTGCPCVLQGHLRQDAEATSLGGVTMVTNINLATEAADLVGGFDRRDFGGTRVVVAEPGNHTYTLSILRQTGTSTGLSASYATLVAQLIPFGSDGAAPAAVSVGPAASGTSATS